VFADGMLVEATGESFEVVFSTVARWRDGRIVEEYLAYDTPASSSRSGSA
jgi:ketosteroid isomerase-like protein